VGDDPGPTLPDRTDADGSAPSGRPPPLAAAVPGDPGGRGDAGVRLPQGGARRAVVPTRERRGRRAAGAVLVRGYGAAPVAGAEGRRGPLHRRGKNDRTDL